MSTYPNRESFSVILRYFCASVRRKSPRFACRNPCTARLPGHLIPLEASCRPLELPRLNFEQIHLSRGFLTSRAGSGPEIGPDPAVGFSMMYPLVQNSSLCSKQPVGRRLYFSASAQDHGTHNGIRDDKHPGKGHADPSGLEGPSLVLVHWAMPSCPAKLEVG